MAWRDAKNAIAHAGWSVRGLSRVTMTYTLLLSHGGISALTQQEVCHRRAAALHRLRCLGKCHPEQGMPGKGAAARQQEGDGRHTYLRRRRAVGDSISKAGQ